MKKAILFFAILFSVITIYGQKNIHDMKIDDSYVIGDYYPSRDGYILKNIKFETKVNLDNYDYQKHRWDIRSYLRGYDIVAYLYKSKKYSMDELAEAAKKYGLQWSEKFWVEEFSIRFKNGHTILVKFGDGITSGGFDHKIYLPSHKIEGFEISRVEPIGIIDNRYVKAIVDRINKEKKKEEEKELEEKNPSRKDKKENSSGKKSSTKKSTNKDASESDNTNDDDIYAVRRRLDEARKKEAARKKAAFNKSVKKVEKTLAKGFTGAINSALNGGGSLKFAYGIRTIESKIKPLASPLDGSTLEIGYGFGKLGVFVGYNLFSRHDDLNTDTRKADGNTYVFGLDYTLCRFKFLNSSSDVGLNVEYGFGDIKYEWTNNQIDFSSNFYSIGAQIRFLNFLYVSYNYGLFKDEDTRNVVIEGNYTKLGFGVKYDFGY
jgi:hypothetical protein